MNRIAIVGQMHAGKTTCANSLRKRGFDRYSFAQPLKDITGKMLTVFERRVMNPNAEPIQMTDDLKGHPAIRKLLQIVGDDIGRQWTGNPNTWVELLEQKLEKASAHELLVIDDCRYWNEYDMLKSQGFVFIRVNRDEIERITSITSELERTMPHLTVDDRR